MNRFQALLLLASPLILSVPARSQQTQSGTTEGITGIVTGPDGRPVTGAAVNAEALSDPRPAIPEIAIVTDDSGRYNWRLFPGDYAITVIAEGFHEMTKKATVVSGRLTTLDFQLERKR